MIAKRQEGAFLRNKSNLVIIIVVITQLYTFAKICLNQMIKRIIYVNHPSVYKRSKQSIMKPALILRISLVMNSLQVLDGLEFLLTRALAQVRALWQAMGLLQSDPASSWFSEWS